MTTNLNQLVLLRTTTTRYHAAVTVHMLVGGNADLLVLGDGADWEDFVPAAYYARPFANQPPGTGVGEWQPVPVNAEIAAAIATAVSGGLTGYASETYVVAELAAAVAGLASLTAVTSAIATAIAGACAVPATGAPVSTPTLGTSYHPSATRPVRVNVYCDVALPSALLAAQSATVQLQAGSTTNPSTVVAGPVTPTNGALNPGPLTIPVTLSYDLPAGHYYQVVKSAGAGTVTITRIEETLA